ncbi:MAG: ferrochelatase, partial [Candidatus Latescibacterota bacterium]
MSRRGILLVNLGSPASPSAGDVRAYLREFLMDERVIDVPYLLRFVLVNFFVLPFRPKRSAEAYRSIWTTEGSPLVVTSRKVQRLLQNGMNAPVALAMRYGSPSIESGIRELLETPEHGVEEIMLVPLFPHYAMSTTEGIVTAARKALVSTGSNVRMHVLPPFYDNAHYIRALSDGIREYLDQGYDHLLFSYHGLPERHVKKADPTGRHCLRRDDCCVAPSKAHGTCYRHQVMRTTELVAEKLGLEEGAYSVAFQSRLGRDKWLTPFAHSEIVRLAESGIKKLVVVCPSFVSDCLETLEEIGIQARRAFYSAGGEEFELIPCLNDDPLWI